MRKTTGIATALTAAAAAACVAVLPASGQSPAGARTLTFTSTQKSRDFKSLDLGARGPSVGDRFEFASILSQGGEPVGRLEADCVGVEPTYQALECTLVAILADGRITLQGAYLQKKLPGVGGTDEQYAITGGTGAYANASGAMTRSGNGKHDTLTFTLAG